MRPRDLDRAAVRIRRHQRRTERQRSRVLLAVMDAEMPDVISVEQAIMSAFAVAPAVLRGPAASPREAYLTRLYEQGVFSSGIFPPMTLPDVLRKYGREDGC